MTERVGVPIEHTVRNVMIFITRMLERDGREKYVLKVHAVISSRMRIEN